MNVLSTQTGATTTVHLGNGNNTVAVSGQTGVSGVTGQLGDVSGPLVLAGGSGTNTLTVDDSGETVGQTGILGGGGSNQIFGLGMGGSGPTVNQADGITYQGFASLLVKLGAGGDNVTISGTSTATTLDTGAGGDSIIVGPNLSQILASIMIDGHTGDKVSVSPTVDSNITLNAVSPTIGQLTADVMPAGVSVEFQGVDSTNVNLAAGTTNNVTILGSATPITVNSNGFTDKILVEAISQATTINLGGGTDTATVQGTGAGLLQINGTTGGTDLLVVDRSAATAALTSGIIEDDAAKGTGHGIVTGLTAGDIDFFNLPRVNVLLGSGNDRFMINTSTAILPATEIDVEGNGGDDFIEAKSVSSARTIVNGGAGQNTLQVDIVGVPFDNEFTSIQQSVQLLTVNDTANTTTPIAWLLKDTELFATPSGGSQVDVISTSVATLTNILGSTTPTASDTLDIDSTTPANVNGTVSGNTITLSTGLSVVSQPDPSTDFNTFQNYGPVINFDGLADGLQAHQISNAPGQNTNPVYISNGFGFSTSDAAGFTLDNSISPAAQAKSTGLTGDTFTLQTVSTTGAVTGDGFTLYSLELADTDTTGSASVTVTGDLITGGSISMTLTVNAGSGFQLESLPTGFIGLKDVKFSNITSKGLSFDNIVAVDNLPNVPNTVTPATVPTFAVTSALTINTGALGSGNGFSISGTIQRDGVTVNLSSLTLNGAAVDGIKATYASDVFTISFAGDLDINSNISATGGNALAFDVANDVSVATGVTLSVSASPNGQTAGAGGGSAGGASTGGTGATTVGVGGAAGAGGSGGGGGDHDDDDGGNGGDGTNGTSGTVGSAGSNSAAGGQGGAGVNSGAGGAGGAGATGRSGRFGKHNASCANSAILQRPNDNGRRLCRRWRWRWWRRRQRLDQRRQW